MRSGTMVMPLSTRKGSSATEKPLWWECLGCDKLESDQVRAGITTQNKAGILCDNSSEL